MDSFKLMLKSMVQTFAIITGALALFYMLFYMTVVADKNYKQTSELIEDSGDYFISKTIVLDNLEKIPLKHLEVLKDNGYKIVIGTEALDKYNAEHDTKATGLADHENKRIYLKPFTDWLGFNTIHEVGHVLNQVYGRPSDTEEFKALFESEKHNMNGYGIQNPSEYFAELYVLQFKPGKYMFKEDFPKTTEYMTQLHWW